jgi:hypothetical protein
MTTKEEIYELARKQYAEPAVLCLGGECILGYWIKRSEAKAMPLMFTCKTQGVVLVARGATWEEVVAKSGLLSPLKTPLEGVRKIPLPFEPTTKKHGKLKGSKR